HELAAGLSIERSKLPEFRRRINEYASQFLTRSDAQLPLEVECLVTFSDITMRGIEEMQTLEPFGLMNPPPVLMMRHVTLADLVPLSGGKHVKFKIRPESRQGGNAEVAAIYFNVPPEMKMTEGNICDVVFTADINEYMGMRSPQVTVKEIRLSGVDGADAEDGENAYRRLIDPEDHSPADKENVPILDDFRKIYRYLKRDVLEGSKQMAISATCRAMEQEDIHVSYCKLKIVLDVLRNEGLIDCEYRDGGKIAEVRILPVGKKVSLDRSPLLCMIRSNHPTA
ncbi:MAG: hypothetical protein ILO68_07365, partial [Clostridia bacterium]|nr:hypothetical protein [Clostridia bacterium]